MTRHVIDHPHRRTKEKLSRFLKLDREQGETPAKATEQLQRSPRKLDNAGRMQRFLRILRRGD